MIDEDTLAPEEEHVQQQDSRPLSLFDLLRILRTAGSALYTHAALHAELAKVDWAAEKFRLQRMFWFSLLGVVCLLGVMAFSGLLLVLVFWDTSLRLPSLMVLIGLYAFGVFYAWRRFEALSTQRDSSFAATRREIAADIELLRSKL